VSSARAVIDAGYADPDKICIQGHSWGGYETSFIVTQTDMFACVVTGAPLTNLISMYNINYKRSGNPNGPILEWSQGRMNTSPYHDFDLYVSQSPLHHVANITTPFMILHGTADGAVDWNQGLEYYNAARRMGKEVILLSYPDEPHHLGKEENQKDFQIRMRQYFDHYLKGTPMPRWMADGVPFLQKDRTGPKDGVGGDRSGHYIASVLMVVLGAGPWGPAPFVCVEGPDNPGGEVGRRRGQSTGLSEGGCPANPETRTHSPAQETRTCRTARFPTDSSRRFSTPISPSSWPQPSSSFWQGVVPRPPPLLPRLFGTQRGSPL
jgi:hypothetical protein